MAMACKVDHRVVAHLPGTPQKLPHTCRTRTPHQLPQLRTRLDLPYSRNLCLK